MSHDAGSESPAELDIVDALAQLSFAVQNALGRRAATLDLSMTQVRLLGILRDRTPGIVDLARLLELDKSSVTGLVDRAAKRGLVRRESSPDDRRVSRVALTESGRELVEAVAAEFATDVHKLLDGLSSSDVEDLRRIASRIALEELSAGMAS